ncbi:MAG: terminase small subunit [Gammaproteobacteria bacterium]|nr:terminase small subunit [Gammaproteobacteria bacterium]
MLTKKQQLFVDEYLIDLNATQAAIRAGYSCKTAFAIGHENLSKPKIQSALVDAIDKRKKRTEVTQDMVIDELARVAFFDIRKLFQDDGSLVPIHELPAGVAAAIGGLDVASVSMGDEEKVTTKKVKIIDKKGALELLGRHLQMFTDKVHVTGNVSLTLDKILDQAEGTGLTNKGPA